MQKYKIIVNVINLKPMTIVISKLFAVDRTAFRVAEFYFTILYKIIT